MVKNKGPALILAILLMAVLSSIREVQKSWSLRCRLSGDDGLTLFFAIDDVGLTYSIDPTTTLE